MNNHELEAERKWALEHGYRSVFEWEDEYMWEPGGYKAWCEEHCALDDYFQEFGPGEQEVLYFKRDEDAALFYLTFANSITAKRTFE